MQRVKRRTIATGAAWAVPVIVVGASAPAASASGTCTPSFEAQAGSIKCCNGKVKNMKLIIKVTDPTGCVPAGTPICITGVRPATGNPSVGQTDYVPSACVAEGGTVTVFLRDVSNCTVNLNVFYTLGADPTVYVTPLKSLNISDSDGECSA